MGVEGRSSDNPIEIINDLIRIERACEGIKRVKL